MKTLDALVKEIMSSNGWEGSVVIECFPAKSEYGDGVEVHWRTDEQGGQETPPTQGTTIREALTLAAKEAREWRAR